ncbi:hypothetical protein HZS_2976 [Henneguya salminicola]|nr:hypothetical protein HZS_2976 [Henneguya salminicola]
MIYFTLEPLNTENFKFQKNRKEQFSKDIVVPTLINSNDVKKDDGLKYRSASSYNYNSQSDSVINMDSQNRDQSSQTGNSTGKLQDQLLIIQEAVPTYLEDRLNAVQTIESTIIELGGIFQQLAHMVNEQEENIQRIDHCIEMTNLHVDSAHSELTKYFKSINSNRWLMVKIFGVLFVFIIIFILLT